MREKTKINTKAKDRNCFKNTLKNYSFFEPFEVLRYINIDSLFKELFLTKKNWNNKSLGF